MMNFQKKRYKLAGRFIVVYILIVTVLSADQKYLPASSCAAFFR